MAIRMMTDKSEYLKNPADIEVVTNFHGHEITRVFHDSKCPHYTKYAPLTAECLPHDPDNKVWGCHHFEPLYMKTTHKGLVLDLGEYNGYDDSDFYAVVWNWEKNAPERIQYATTRGWSYPNGAKVDATPEVIAAYAKYLETVREKERIRRAEIEKKTVRKGKTVKVVRGRKLPIGTVGLCFWTGATKFGYSVGIETPEGRKFTALGNVEVVLEEEEAA